MRRADREITDRARLRAVLEDSQVLHIGYRDQAGLAVVPMSFGFEWQGENPVFYVHSALEGRKVSAFEQGCPVALELETGYSLVESRQPCGYSCRFRSVMAAGRVRPAADREEKLRGLQAIMTHYSGRDWTFAPEAVERVKVFVIETDELTGKEHE